LKLKNSFLQNFLNKEKKLETKLDDEGKRWEEKIRDLERRWAKKKGEMKQNWAVEKKQFQDTIQDLIRKIDEGKDEIEDLKKMVNKMKKMNL